MLFSQTTFPALYQCLCLSDSDLWLSFSRSSQCEQEIPSSIAKKITPFQQVGFQSKPCILSTKCNNLSLFTGHVRFLYTRESHFYINIFSVGCLVVEWLSARLMLAMPSAVIAGSLKVAVIRHCFILKVSSLYAMYIPSVWYRAALQIALSATCQ